jgi:hypothetical protein
MTLRQQVLYLWLSEGALDTAVIAWAFHDGTKGRGPGLPKDAPPYATGRHALEAGWFLLQSPAPYSLQPGAEHGTSYLPNEFIFERRIEVED